MADDLAEVTSIQLTDAPASIQLDAYRGSEGDRGAYIIPGSGNPSLYFDVATQTYTFPDPTGAEEELVAQLYDWYLDLDTTSPTYMSTFQLKKTNQWEQIFKVIPNVYNTNRVIPFINGSATTNVVVPKETLLLSQKFGDQTQTSDFDIFRIPTTTDITSTVTSESEMLALSGQVVGNYAYRSDRSQFFRLISLPSSDIGSWQEELAINLDVDIENAYPGLPYPVMSAFTSGKPTYNGTNYTFPITINASQVMPGTNLVTNPSMETVTSGTVVMRRNLCTNPNFETNITGWTANGSTIISRDTSTFYAGAASIKAVTAGTGPAEGPFSSNVAVAGLIAGTKFSVSAWVKAPAGATLRITAVSTGTGAVNTLSAFTGTGAWQYVKAEGATVGVNQNPYAFISTNLTNQAITFYVDNVMIEMGDTVGPYFDGSTSASNGWSYAWSGTANASISTAASAATTVRTNLVTNPSFETNTTGWFSNNTGQTLSRDTTTFYSGGASLKIVCDGTVSAQGTYSSLTAPGGLTAGSKFSVSAWVNAPAGTVLRFIAGSGGTGAVNVTNTITAVGGWQLMKAEGATLGASLNPYVNVFTTTALAVTYYVDNAMIELGDTVGSYFDGSYSPNGDFSYAWTGTANASTSIQRGATVTSWAGTFSAGIQSTNWASSGTRSIRVIPTSTVGSASRVTFTVPTVVGTTYTVRGVIRLTAALTGTLFSNSRKILAYNAATTVILGTSNQATNAAGVYPLSLTFTATDTTTNILCYNGTTVGNGDVWFDDLMVIEGTYTGEYFDINPYPINSPRTAHISISVI